MSPLSLTERGITTKDPMVLFGHETKIIVEANLFQNQRADLYEPCSRPIAIKWIDYA
jgi:hypothetical protein